MSRFKKLGTKIFYFVSIWLIPSNLFFKFSVSNAYVNGRLVDYLVPKIYALDLAVLGFIIFNFWESGKLSKKNWSLKKVFGLTRKVLRNKLVKILLALLLALTIRQLFSSHPIVSSIYLLRVGLYSLFAFCVTTEWKKLKIVTIPALIFSGLVQLVIATYQFTNQKPLLAYQWLGESKIDLGIGIAHTTFAGAEQVLAYGTTAHPNILAGIVVFFWLWLISLTEKWPKRKETKKNWLLYLGLIVVLAIIFMTQSFSALLGLISAIMIWRVQTRLNKKQIYLIIFSILLFIPILLHFSSLKWNNLSLTRRSRLNNAGIRLFLKNPILGTGLATSTTAIESVQTAPEKVRFVQPPHHAMILLLTEVGLLGLSTLAVILIITKNGLLVLKKSAYLWVFIAVLMSLDHYLLTSSSGLIILITLLFQSFNE